MADLSGQSIDRFQILEQLGQGGMATVYKAYDTRLSREVAIKIIRTELFSPVMLEKLMERFDREAKSLARLSNSNIVNIYDYGEYQQSPYFVMAYLSGGTLKARMGKPMPTQHAIRLLIPIARALAYAHSQGIIHRDVKPANILFSGSGDPILTDFGIVKIVGEESGQTLTGTGLGIGTPEYMAPEQWLGQEVDGRADIYALGIILFELVTGHKPYEADTPNGVMLKHFNDPIPEPRRYLPGIPVDVVRVIFKALAKKPEYRYENMGVFACELEQLVSGGVHTEDPNRTSDAFITQTSGSQTNEIKGWVKILLGLVGIGLLIGLVVVLLTYKNPGDERTSISLTAENTAIAEETVSPESTLRSLETQVFEIALWEKQTEMARALESPVITTEAPTIIPSSPSLTPTSSLVPPECTEVGQEWLSQVDGMVLVCVPAGDFTMGSSMGDINEQPRHNVYLDSYWIDQTEVTNDQFTAFVSATHYQTTAEKEGWSYVYTGSGWSHVEGANWQHPIGPESSLSGFGQYPVVHVSWLDANAYCEWAERELPSEAQWEKAARGDDGRTYPWGNIFDGTKVNFSDLNTNFDWSDKSVNDGYAKTAPVSSYQAGASPYGGLNMTGNVWEWVLDWYQSDYYRAYVEGQWPANPTGPSKDTGYKVLRGGSWDYSEPFIRSTSRLKEIPNTRDDDIGFRCSFPQP